MSLCLVEEAGALIEPKHEFVGYAEKILSVQEKIMCNVR